MSSIDVRHQRIAEAARIAYRAWHGRPFVADEVPHGFTRIARDILDALEDGVL